MTIVSVLAVSVLLTFVVLLFLRSKAPSLTTSKPDIPTSPTSIKQPQAEADEKCVKQIQDLGCNERAPYELQGDHNAEASLREALLACSRALGDDHLEVARCLCNLAAFYESRNKTGWAEALYRRASEIRVERVQTLRRNAGAYELNRDYQNAEATHLEALRSCRETLGEEHLESARCFYNLAGFYESRNDNANAAALYRRALEIRRRLLGTNDPCLPASTRNLAALYRKLGRYEEAAPLLREATEVDTARGTQILFGTQNFSGSSTKQIEGLALPPGEAIGDIGAADHASRKTADGGPLFISTVNNSSIQRQYRPRRMKASQALGKDERRKLSAPISANRGHQTQREREWPSQAFPKSARTDIVDCTVFAPPSAPVSHTFFVQVFAHRPKQAAVAHELAKAFDDETEIRGFKSLEMTVARRSTLLFHLTMPGFEIDGRQQSLVWRGAPEAVQFGVRVPRDFASGNVIGTVTVSLHGVPIGHVKFKLKVTSSSLEARPRQLKPTGTTARHYEKIFISYAACDRQEVLKRVQMLARLGIDFFQDITDLEPGQLWEQELYRHIDESDLFLLFWSNGARDSEWVLKEVRYALSRKGADGLTAPEIVPIPIEGPPPVEPPPELKHLHFNDYFLYLLA